MTIKLVDNGTEGVLLLDGRLDSNSAPDAEEIFLQMSERFDRLVLNMARVNYISSAGLRAIKRIYLAMRKKGGELVLTNVNRIVMEVFEITKFVGFLTFE